MGIAVTEKLKKLFVKTVAETGTYLEACAVTGLTRMSVWRARKADPAFAAACEEAQQIAAKAMEDEAIRRAKEGWDEPVYHQGRIVGYNRRYSDTMLMFLLRGHMAEKYADRSKTEIEHKGAVALNVVTGVPHAEQLAPPDDAQIVDASYEEIPNPYLLEDNPASDLC